VIARLVGSLVSRDGHRGVVDVRDVGYAVHAPNTALDGWAADGGPVEIHVVTDVREDAITLYGFATDLDRRAFEALREVSGVGPKLALATLDTLDLGELVTAVERDDLVTIARVPGIGKKLAQRMALELKGKLPSGFLPTGLPVGPSAAAPAPRDDDLELALARLGYGRTEIVRALGALVERGVAPDAPTGDRLRVALAVLSGGRG
jgi:Holliday junction DNA helicase RuvA